MRNRWRKRSYERLGAFADPLRRYEDWSDDRFAGILHSLRKTIPYLAKCDPVRICDFWCGRLVRNTGNPNYPDCFVH